MKKYVASLLSIVLAIGLSAFNKGTQNFGSYNLKLTIAGAPYYPLNVSYNANWSSNGYLWGDCYTSSADLACTIVADEKYTHSDGEDNQVLNDITTPGYEPYLIISETEGIYANGFQYYKIDNIIASDNSTDFSFSNGRLSDW